MKRLFVIILCFYTFNSNGQSQAEMNDYAMEQYSKSNETKDSIVSEIKKIYQNDTEFLLSFEKTEELWEKFIDEQFKVEFPSFESWENRNLIYGSSFEMCYYYFLKKYTDLRISTLENIVKIEGDVCGG